MAPDPVHMPNPNLYSTSYNLELPSKIDKYTATSGHVAAVKKFSEQLGKQNQQKHHFWLHKGCCALSRGNYPYSDTSNNRLKRTGSGV